MGGRFTALCLALLAGCGGGGEPVEPGAAGTSSEARPEAPAAVTAAAPVPINGSPSAPRAALESAGEMALERGMVQRVYRVRFHNGPQARVGLVAQLVSTGSGATVVDGRVVVGDLAPGAVVTPVDTITLRHAGDLVIDIAALHWQLTESDRDSGSAGTLLLGAPDEPAVAALRPYALPAEVLATAAVGTTLASPRGARLSVVIRRSATVEQVNSTLRGVNARIAEMRPGNHTLLLQLPGPDQVEALQRLAQVLRDSAAFESVTLARAAAGGDAATAPPPPPDPEPDFNDHRSI